MALKKNILSMHLVPITLRECLTLQVVSNVSPSAVFDVVDCQWCTFGAIASAIIRAKLQRCTRNCACANVDRPWKAQPRSIERLTLWHSVREHRFARRGWRNEPTSQTSPSRIGEEELLPFQMKTMTGGNCDFPVSSLPLIRTVRGV